MENMHKDDDKLMMTVSDFFRLCRRQYKTILKYTFIFGFLGMLFALLKPVEYKVEATFKEKSSKQANLSSSVMNFLPMFQSQESEATSMIKSRKLMESVVRKLNLQGEVVQDCYKDTYFLRIYQHLKTDWSHFNHNLFPTFPNRTCPFVVENIHYEGETPIVLKIQPSDSGYTIFDQNKNKLGDGSYGVPFIQSTFQFTINQKNRNNDSYPIVIWPLNFKSQQIIAGLKVETDKNDKNLMKILYQCPDRQLGCQIVNTLMKSFQEHLENFHKTQSDIQLAYLKDRRDANTKELLEIMKQYAKDLSQDIAKTGVYNSEEEIEFFIRSQQDLKTKLLHNELSTSRLENLLKGKCVYYDQFSADDGDSRIVNNILTQIREQKKNRDGLELSLANNFLANSQDIRFSFKRQLEELKEIQNYSLELDQIISAYKKGQTPNFSLSIFNDPRYLLKTWHDSLTHSTDQNSLVFYLENLKKLLSYNEKIIHERLTHQQNPSLEFQGINSQTAQDLFINYSKNLSELHAEIQQNQFLIKQVENPNFEISSLSPTLNDTVSAKIISKASDLIMELKDENNRSIKEQERLQKDLAIQRGFLLSHLKQLNELKELRSKLLEEKIYSLQSAQLEQVHQDISVSEKNLSDYILSRLENLKTERTIVQKHLDELSNIMSSLPYKWVDEKLIEQNVETGQLIVQEVAKMVESKNITQKLELIQSAPVDIAIPPLHPLPSDMMLYSFLGMFLGSLSSIGFLVGRSLKSGILASSTNLKINGQHVSGQLSTEIKEPLHDRDLETLRRLQTYCDEKIILLIEGYGPDYSIALAKLMKQEVPSILRILLSSAEQGLNEYLKGENQFPEIRHDEGGDLIEGGGITRFSLELFRSDRFSNLLNKLKEKYETILIVTHAKPFSAEAELLAHFFPACAVSVQDETTTQLEFFMKLSKDKKITFVMLEQDDV